MDQAAAILGIGRNTLIRGLKELKILNQDGSINNSNGQIRGFYPSLAVRQTIVGSLGFYAAKVDDVGIEFLRNVILDYPDSFKARKRRPKPLHIDWV